MIVATAILLSIASVQAEDVTLQWCVTMYKEFSDGIARKVYALPNAVICETSKAISVYHAHYQEFGAKEEEGKQKFVASPGGSKCMLEKPDAPFELMKGRTEEEVGGAMSLGMSPKQRFSMTLRVRRQGDSKVLFTSNRDWEFFRSAEKAVIVDKLTQCCTLMKEPNCLTVPR